MSFEVKIPLFEGPFDLLLFFIKRDELDIHDIPIATITNDFFAYMAELEKMNMEVASEFILVAATLMRIKAKMLLPRVEVDEDGNEVDPRADLVKHLLEYKKYKSTLAILEGWEQNMLQKEQRGNTVKEIHRIAAENDLEIELQNVDLYKLLKVYQQLLRRQQVEKERPIHKVVPYPYKIETQKERILQLLEGQKELAFSTIITQDFNKVAIIFNFLAVLELIAINKVRIRMGLGHNNFWISKKDSEEVD